jgi:formamidopyrimidine-DNA glycosylase
MPEGPEVQIQVDHLNKLSTWKVKKLSTHDLRWLGKRKKMEILLGSELISVNRKAKYLIFTFKKLSDNYYIINHLAMSGGWLIRKPDEKMSIHTRVTLCFEKNDQLTTIDFVDARHFGRLDFYNSTEFWGEKIQSKLSNLGPDALSDQITVDILNQRIHDITEHEPNWEIKPLLMNQAFLAGIGNIYASEICFLSGISPFIRASNLTQEEIRQLEEAIPAVMKTAYENGGSTIRTYKSPDGKAGWAERMIYGRKYCRLCNTPISKGPQAGRSTYWCSKCQQMVIGEKS